MSAAAEKGIPGLSMLYNLMGITSLDYHASGMLPPQLAALLPPQNTRNVQRKLLTQLIDKKNWFDGTPHPDMILAIAETFKPTLKR